MKTLPDINIQSFSEIPLVLINEKEILFINEKAKELLLTKKVNKTEIHKILYKSIHKKSSLVEINNKYIKVEKQKIKFDKKKIYLLFLEDITEILEDKNELQQKVKLYEDIFEDLPIGVLIHDFGKTKYINKYGLKVLQAKSKKEYLDFNILNFLISDKDRNRAIRRINSSNNYLSPEIYTIKNFKGEEKVIELSSFLFPFVENKQNSIVRLIVFTDKTEQIKQQQIEIQYYLKHQENQLLKKQNEAKQKLLDELNTKRVQLFNTINYSDYLFWITDEKLNIVLFNHAFYNYCVKYYNVKIKVGDNTLQLQELFDEVEPETIKTRKEVIQNILNTKTDYSYEIRHFDKELKKYRIYKITFKPYLVKNKVVNFYCYGHEVTEKYEFLNQIENQSIKLKTIIENSPIYLWSMNKNLEITLFNSNYKNLIKSLYGEYPEIGKKLSKGKYAQNTQLIETLNYHYQKAFTGSKENFKLNFELENHKLITLDVSLFPIIVDNEVQEVSGIATDITAEVEKQKQLETLLHENEILMKEIHHRIKNNLQVISSMINLQIQNEQNPQSINVLKDTQNRVYSMAMIHQSLYQNRNYATINISANILALVQHILYSFNQTDIELQTDLDDIILDVNTSIPLSLIINEVVTNIVKYAYPERFQKNKKIEILFKRQNISIQLKIKDHGIGIPENFIENTNSTGFTIIRALSEQINAQLFIHSIPNEGTEIKLTIPLI
ncbi:MAG: hypothetical protein KatS3mg027_2610 [Bacteroidia bacterium]|nr:MAG: hypothetical protein KatS3mg027_2610 [Bacteroidia bacterium]